MAIAVLPNSEELVVSHHDFRFSIGNVARLDNVMEGKECDPLAAVLIGFQRIVMWRTRTESQSQGWKVTNKISREAAAIEPILLTVPLRI